MTKKELIEILNNSFAKDDDEVVIEIYKHGSIGATPSVDVKSVNAGFDWNNGKLIITPKVALKKADLDYEEQIKILTKEIGKLKLSKGVPVPVATPTENIVKENESAFLQERLVAIRNMPTKRFEEICVQNGYAPERISGDNCDRQTYIDIEAYLPPDDSEGWTIAKEIIAAHSETESAFNDAILALKLQTLSDYQGLTMRLRGQKPIFTNKGEEV